MPMSHSYTYTIIDLSLTLQTNRVFPSVLSFFLNSINSNWREKKLINRRHAIHRLHSRFANLLLRRTSISLEETVVTIKFIFIRILFALTFPKVKVSNIEKRISPYHLLVYISLAQILELFLRIYFFLWIFQPFHDIIPIRTNPPLNPLSPFFLFFFFALSISRKTLRSPKKIAKDKIVPRVLVSNFHGFARNPIVNSGLLFSRHTFSWLSWTVLPLSSFLSLSLYASHFFRLIPLFLYTSQISLRARKARESSVFIRQDASESFRPRTRVAISSQIPIYHLGQ